MITIEYQRRRVNTDDIDNPTDQTVRFLITDENGNQYQFGADINKDIAEVDIPEYLDEHAREYVFLLRLMEYKSGAYRQMEGDFTDDLEQMEAWITAGCKKQVGTDENEEPIYKTIEKITIPNLIA